VTISELGLAYLRHIDSIKAGEAALRADILATLEDIRSALARIPGSQELEKADYGCVLRVGVHGVESLFVLILRWEVGVDSALPRISINAEGDPSPEPELGECLGAQWRDIRTTRVLDRAVVQDDPVHACVTAWSEALASVSHLTEARDFQQRAAGIALLRAASRNLLPMLEGRVQDAPIESSASGETWGMPGWPCFIQWDVQLDGGARATWCLTFNPRYGKNSLPWLGLVVEGGLVNQSLEQELYISGVDAPAPVVANFSELLGQALEGTLSVSKAAGPIAATCAKVYDAEMAARATAKAAGSAKIGK